MGNMNNALSFNQGKQESLNRFATPLSIGNRIKVTDTGHSHTVDEGSIVKGSKVRGLKGAATTAQQITLALSPCSLEFGSLQTIGEA